MSAQEIRMAQTKLRSLLHTALENVGPALEAAQSSSGEKKSAAGYELVRLTVSMLILALIYFELNNFRRRHGSPRWRNF